MRGYISGILLLFSGSIPPDYYILWYLVGDMGNTGERSISLAAKVESDVPKRISIKELFMRILF